MSYAVVDRLVYDTSGNYTKRDFTNAPCPTVTVGMGFNHYHYQVHYHIQDAPRD